MKCSVTYFVDEKTNKLMWQCPNRMGIPTKHDAKTTTRCWRHNCKGIKPPNPIMFCNAQNCNKIKKNHPDSLYWSDRCSKRERDRRYRLKKKTNVSF